MERRATDGRESTPPEGEAAVTDGSTPGKVNTGSDGTLFGSAEQVTLCHDHRIGLRAVIAVDDVTLGPGLGGIRWARYPDERSAVDEACRLARVMTLKNAVAGLPYGGAKSVILLDETVEDRGAVMRSFGRFVQRLGGAYVPGVDMGTTVADLAEVATVAADVSCDDVDPSGWTALGVLAGIEAAVDHVEGRELRGMTVVVQGAGHVGAALSRMLADKGCRVVVADIDPVRARAVATDVSGEVADPHSVVSWPCDVLAPCAVGRVITRDTAGLVRARFVAGAANDVLDERACAELLAEYEVTYVPDFVLNAGGVIEIHARRAGWDHARLRDEVMAIGDRVRGVLEVATTSGSTPLEVAEGLAWAWVGRPVRLLDRSPGNAVAGRSPAADAATTPAPAGPTARPRVAAMA